MDIQPEDYINIIAPPPIVLVSTLYGNVRNAAPFGMVMPVSHNPPMMALGIFAYWDTFRNIVDLEEFVVAYPAPELVRNIEITAERFPREVSEFDKAGLTATPSIMVKPFRIKECQVNLECRLEWHKSAGDHQVVVGRIVAADIWDELYREDLARSIIDPVYDAGSPEFRFAKKGGLIK